jgi:hypothetical protein
MKIRGGIDPGKKGYVVYFVEYDDKPTQIKSFPMPVIGKEYDIKFFLDTVREIFGVGDKYFVVENVHAIKGGGSTGNFQFGRGTMLIEAGLTSYNIPFTKITPNKWQKYCWEGVTVQTKPNPKNKSGISTDTKATSLIAAKRLFPSVDLRNTERCTTAHEGKVDALLMAHYCLKHF